VIVVRLHLEQLGDGGLPRPERLTVLRGQLTFLRIGIEQGIPISVATIARAEELARTLELYEVAA
jgi:hypothetical protein